MVLLRQSGSWCETSVSRVAPDGACHAMAATTAAAEFGAANGDDLDPRLAQKRIRVGVAVVGDDDAGLERDDIVAIVPLFALGLVGIAAGFDGAQLRQVERLGDDIEHRPIVRVDLECAVVVLGVHAVAADLIDDLGKQGDDIAIAKAENRVEVHGRTALRHQAADHSLCRLAPEQGLRHLADGLVGRTLAHADQHGAVADRHDVAALHRGIGERLVRIAPPDLEIAAEEDRMKLVDRTLDQRLGASCRPEHRVAGHAAIDPTGGVALKQGIRDRRDNEIRLRQGAEHQRLCLDLRQVGDCDAADHEGGELRGRHFIKPWPHRLGDLRAKHIWGNAPVQQEIARLLVGERLAEQVVEFEDFDPPFLHL
ncbi:hypothetical protein RHECNPAF_470050 [Rhizobium etli CNPAF512]|nr:hypothetical protein RHECNPAF_470050 [Rhizobium etli CNPAF512]